MVQTNLRLHALDVQVEKSLNESSPQRSNLVDVVRDRSAHVDGATVNSTGVRQTGRKVLD
jgi:hypothetical protein